jgi:hypothetical protein
MITTNTFRAGIVWPAHLCPSLAWIFQHMFDPAVSSQPPIVKFNIDFVKCEQFEFVTFFGIS